MKDGPTTCKLTMPASDVEEDLDIKVKSDDDEYLDCVEGLEDCGVACLPAPGGPRRLVELESPGVSCSCELIDC